MTKIRLLIVDDEIKLCNIIKDTLMQLYEDYKIYTAYSGDDALEILKREEVDVMVTDIKMPGIGGIELMERAIKLKQDMQTIIITGHGDLDNAIEAMRLGAINYLKKPISTSTLHYTILKAYEKIDLKKKLERSEKHFRFLAENTIDIIAKYDNDIICTYVSPACVTISGYQPDEIVGKSFFDFVHQDDKDEILLNLNSKVTNVDSSVHVYRFKHKLGHHIWLEANVRKIYEENRDIQIGYISVMRDVTERKEFEDALRESELKFRQLAENVQEVFWLRTNDKMLYINPAYEKVWGRTCESLYKNPDSFIASIHPDDKHDVIMKFRNVIDEKTNFNEEYRIIRPDGSVRWVWARTFPVEGPHGETKRVGIADDITDRKQYEFEIIEARKKAEDANRTKTEFIANVSHELRTPLNSILGFCQVLSKKDITKKETNQSINVIYNSSKHLLEMINNLLDLSKIEIGKTSIEKDYVDLIELFDEIISIVKPIIDEKNVELKTYIDSEVPKSVYTDEMKLRQILINLLNNAIKFTEQGDIILKAEVLPPVQKYNDDIYYLLISVKDTGIGIPKDKQKKIFESFVQADGTLNRKHGGTGLGLSICTKLVEMLDGKIWLKSEEGKGSTFSFTINITDTNESMMKDTPEKSKQVFLNTKRLNNKKVLLVEDDENTARMIKLLTDQLDINLILAVDGEKALKILEKEVPDLILMDIQLPNMSGIDVTKHIRMNKNLDEVPIIATSAFVMVADKDYFKEIGGNDYLTKPIDINLLEAKMRHYIK